MFTSPHFALMLSLKKVMNGFQSDLVWMILKWGLFKYMQWTIPDDHPICDKMMQA